MNLGDTYIFEQIQIQMDEDVWHGVGNKLQDDINWDVFDFVNRNLANRQINPYNEITVPWN